jgi:hypothetical protein
LMLVTDSLSYIPIIKIEELSVIIENMMKDGLYVLFLNHRFAYALFDHFENLKVYPSSRLDNVRMINANHIKE